MVAPHLGDLRDAGGEEGDVLVDVRPQGEDGLPVGGCVAAPTASVWGVCTSCVATSSAFLAPTLVGLKLQASRMRRRRATPAPSAPAAGPTVASGR